ncbi:membrane protein containing DUF1112 [Candidatus Magnetoovum chiemensis]|nr:membrane protein containing DUF1112 [Candidatus Magnetoovum chiemensis]
MRTSNPALRTDTLDRLRWQERSSSSAMTIQGTVNKTVIMLLLTILSSIWVWRLYYSEAQTQVGPYMIAGALGGFIVALITIFKQNWAPYTSPVYAVLEGLFLGGISASFESRYPGIAFQAVSLTFGTLFCLLIAYKSRLITVSHKFRAGIVAATGAICLVYLASLVLSMFNVQIPGIFSNGAIGIGFSVVVVIIAALNLVLDFDFIEKAARSSAPKFMEWYGAFALMVTIIWLYIEILRLLSKISRRE